MESVDQRFRRLKEHYAGMMEGEIGALAAEAYNLTEIGREALAAVIAEKGFNIQLAEAPPPEEPKAVGDSADGLNLNTAPSATRILRGCGGFLANTLAAITGVGVLNTLGSAVVKLFTHTRVSIVLTEWIGSIVFAALLGVSVQRRWGTRTARWVWMPALLWFLLGLITFGHAGNSWLTFSGIACIHARGNPCIPFTVFTVFLLRCSTYSLSAFLSSRSSAQHAAEFHPALSHILTGMFLVGLPKIATDQSAKGLGVTSPDKTE
jgi:hypothetical protein